MVKPNEETKRALDTLAHPDEATLQEWRSDADLWQRDYVYGSRTIQLACQRLSTLIALVQEQRAEIGRLTIMADDSIAELGSFEQRASELSRKVDTLGASLTELRTLVMRGGGGGLSTSAPTTTGEGGRGATPLEPIVTGPAAFFENAAPVHGPSCIGLDQGCADCQRLEQHRRMSGAH